MEEEGGWVGDQVVLGGRWNNSALINNNILAYHVTRDSSMA